jgi:hypothetical protein
MLHMHPQVLSISELWNVFHYAEDRATREMNRLEFCIVDPDRAFDLLEAEVGPRL